MLVSQRTHQPPSSVRAPPAKFPNQPNANLQLSLIPSLQELTPDDKFIVLASDGVWEFLTNQTVTDMILKFDDPLEACRAVVAEAYRLWLQNEV